MRSFPTGPEFTGLNAPIGAEYELEELPVEGRIPAEIAGTFFRAIPDPAFPPYIEDGAAVISGDGMVSALRFTPGRVSFAIRYVQTERHKAELPKHTAVVIFDVGSGRTNGFSLTGRPELRPLAAQALALYPGMGPKAHTLEGFDGT